MHNFLCIIHMWFYFCNFHNFRYCIIEESSLHLFFQSLSYIMHSHYCPSTKYSSKHHNWNSDVKHIDKQDWLYILLCISGTYSLNSGMPLNNFQFSCHWLKNIESWYLRENSHKHIASRYSNLMKNKTNSFQLYIQYIFGSIYLMMSDKIHFNKLDRCYPDSIAGSFEYYNQHNYKMARKI